jgi:small GTP-binding protein
VPLGSSFVAEEAARRRTFAIISHPDAGKTTLTEKLLLYAGAVGEAGAVKGRRGRRAATSDWMQLERRRGISVTSTVLRFKHDETVLNLLDTPGHRDFSEDTLRVLAAVDCAVMLLGAARGVEPQTEQLFQVARARRIPLIAFVNKYDRPGMDPLAMLDHLDGALGLPLAPLTWPVGIPGAFRGVIDRRDGTFHRFGRTAGGADVAPEQVLRARDQHDDDAAAWAVAEEDSHSSMPSDTSSTPRRSCTAAAFPCSSARLPGTSASASCSRRLPIWRRRRNHACSTTGASGGSTSPSRRSPSKCRRTWTRATATGSPSSVSAQAGSSAGCA